VRDFPAFLAYSTERITEHVNFMESHGIENGKSVLTRYAPSLGLGLGAVAQKMQLLREFQVGAAEVITRYPHVLGIGKEALCRKLAYYTNVLRMPSDLLSMRAPVLLGLSLDRRVRPRVAVLSRVAAETGQVMPEPTEARS